MEHTDLNGNPFERVHLQWFGDPAPEPESNPEPSPESAPEPEPEPEPELKAEGWIAQLPDKYKKDQKYLKDLTKHKSFGEIVDRMYAAEAKIPEIPEKAEEYEFDEIQYPEDLAGEEMKEYRETLGSYIKGVVEQWRGVALELGLGKEQAKRVGALMAETVLNQVKAARDEQKRLREESLNQLKADWKGYFVERAELSDRAVRTFGGEGLVEKLARLGIQDDPDVIKAFYEIGRAIGEDTLVPARGKPEPGPEEKKRQALKQRYDHSPELHEPEGGGPTPASSATAEELERLASRYPTMGKSG